MFQKFLSASFIATAITLCVGWAHAAPVKAQPIEWKTPGRCVVTEVLRTDPLSERGAR